MWTVATCKIGRVTRSACAYAADVLQIRCAAINAINAITAINAINAILQRPHAITQWSHTSTRACTQAQAARTGLHSVRACLLRTSTHQSDRQCSQARGWGGPASQAGRSCARGQGSHALSRLRRSLASPSSGRWTGAPWSPGDGQNLFAYGGGWQRLAADVGRRNGGARNS